MRTGLLYLSSISRITCLHAPHGVIGDFKRPFSFLAAIANVVIFSSGWFAWAAKMAVRSAQRPDGKAALRGNLHREGEYDPAGIRGHAGNHGDSNRL